MNSTELHSNEKDGLLKALRQIMKKKRISLSQLAIRLGISRQAVSEAFCGRNITIQWLERVCRVLDVELRFFFSEEMRGAKEELSHTSSRKFALQSEVNRIVKEIIALDNPEKIILFGSLANDNVKDWSDADLLIIKETDKRFLDRQEELLLLVRPRIACDIIVYTPQELEAMVREKNRFVTEEIINRGKVLYEAA